MKKNILILVLVAVIIIVAGYFGYRQSEGGDEITSSTATSTATSTVEQSASTTIEQTVVGDVSGWKTFRSDQYGIEFKYPPTWSPESYSNTSNDGQALYYRLMPGHERYGSFSLVIDNRKSLYNFLNGIKTESGTGVFPVFTVKEFKVGNLNSATITSVPGAVSYFISNQVLELSSGSLLNFRLLINDSKNIATDSVIAAQIKSVIESVKEIK